MCLVCDKEKAEKEDTEKEYKVKTPLMHVMIAIAVGAIGGTLAAAGLVLYFHH